MAESEKFSENELLARLEKIAQNEKSKKRSETDLKEANEVWSAKEMALLIKELITYNAKLETENITLRRSYERVNTERERFGNLYELAPVGFFIVSKEGTIAEINKTGIDLVRVQKSELLNKGFESLVAPHHLEDYYNFLHKMEGTKGKVNTDIQLLLPDYSTLYTRIEGIYVANATCVDSYYITLIDMTESNKIQRALEGVKERLEMTLKVSSTGIWSIEQGTNKMTLDAFSYEIMEMRPAEFNGHLSDFIEWVHPRDRNMVRYNYLLSMNNSSELNLEFRVVLKNGTVKFISAQGQMIQTSHEVYFFVGTFMDITEKKKQAIETESLKVKQQRTILAATLSAQENERLSISRALHDSVCQVLYGIRLNLQSLNYYKKNPREFKGVNKLLDQAIKEIRGISSDLTPSVLKDFGFTAGIIEMASRLSTSDFVIKTKIKKSLDSLDKTVQLYVFRIIQELINNCIKHAKATVAEIIVMEKNGVVTVCVCDNGIGFSKEMTQALREGSGLRGIKNQLFLLQGEVHFKDRSQGTHIEFTFNRNVSLLNL